MSPVFEYCTSFFLKLSKMEADDVVAYCGALYAATIAQEAEC